MNTISESELMLNADGSVYHLNLLPEDIADTIILVGDPDRVAQVSQNFDHIEIKRHKREFITHTGYIGKKRLTVLSTGIGTPNIDIVLNELDALVNIDLKNRRVKNEFTQLNFIRIGTAGTLQAEIPVDTSVITRYAIGLDMLGSYYSLPSNDHELSLNNTFLNYFTNEQKLINTYTVSGSLSLIEKLKANCIVGITATCGGFYAAQGRKLRIEPAIPNLLDKIQSFIWESQTVTNFEMETAGIYALGRLLGHECCSISAIINNRIKKQLSKDIKKTIENLIIETLEKIIA